jgi:putative flavoprotein involved in K+ transport
MDAAGLLDERYDQVPDLLRARNLPSIQLVGTPERATLDLNALRGLGVRLVGRLAGIRDGTALFSGSLPNVCALADLKLDRLLDTIDGGAARAGIGGNQPPQRCAPTEVPAAVALSVDLRASEIASIVWATGYRPELSWLHVPVLDRKGRVVHDGGVTAAPGLYLIGMPFLRRRKSSLIDGAAPDATELTAYLAAYLDPLMRDHGQPPPVRRPVVDLRAS